LFAKEADSGAVLVWDDLVLTLRHLERVKLGGEADVTNKQLHMVGCLFLSYATTL
jgi:hypothetical protein